MPDLDRLKLAFAYHLAEEVVGADRDVAPEEVVFLEQAFSRDQLEAHGLLDRDGFTPAFREAVEEALRVLPAALPEAEKRDLMDLLHDASLSDAQGLESEANVLIVAARLLGLDPAPWAQVGEQAAVKPTSKA